MTDSQRLIQDYARTGSEAAFRELLTGYADLVYSTAVRLVGNNTDLAKDVTQTVFVDLARKARKLPLNLMLGGWLHRHTIFVAATVMRGERRRQLRERQAAEMNAQQDHTAANLSQFAPMLDEAINQLGEEDRRAILLRFFEQQDLRSVGEALGSSEEAARKRIDRALDKLQGLLKRQGVALSAVALGTVLCTQAVTASPAGLVSSLTGPALAAGAVGSGLMSALLNLNSMAKLKLGVGAALVVGALMTPLIMQRQSLNETHQENQSLHREVNRLSQLEADNRPLSNLVPNEPTQSLSAGQFSELLRLRGEVGQLRNQKREYEKALAALEPDAIITRSNRDAEVLNIKKAFAQDIAISVVVFWAHHGQRMPASLEEATSYALLKPEIQTPAQTNGITLDQFELLGTEVHPASDKVLSLIIREKQPVLEYDGTWVRVYVNSASAAEVATSTNGDFTTWEEDHWTTKL